MRTKWREKALAKCIAEWSTVYASLQAQIAQLDDQSSSAEDQFRLEYKQLTMYGAAPAILSDVRTLFSLKQRRLLVLRSLLRHQSRTLGQAIAARNPDNICKAEDLYDASFMKKTEALIDSLDETVVLVQRNVLQTVKAFLDATGSHQARKTAFRGLLKGIQLPDAATIEDISSAIPWEIQARFCRMVRDTRTEEGRILHRFLSRVKRGALEVPLVHVFAAELSAFLIQRYNVSVSSPEAAVCLNLCHRLVFDLAHPWIQVAAWPDDMTYLSAQLEWEAIFKCGQSPTFLFGSAVEQLEMINTLLDPLDMQLCVVAAANTIYQSGHIDRTKGADAFFPALVSAVKHSRLFAPIATVEYVKTALKHAQADASGMLEYYWTAFESAVVAAQQEYHVHN
jgi:hypothetical protein